MKRATWLAVICFGALGFARAEMVSVVQITDMQGQVAFEVKNREELNALLKEIKEETAVFPAVFAECKKEWEADKENKLSFQGNRIKPRSVKKVGEFGDREKAEKKRSQLEERADEKRADEMAKEEKKSKAQSEEDVDKEEARAQAVADAYAMISKKMGDKLGRPIEEFGLPLAEPNNEEGKKEKPKKEEKKAGH